jgi:citrate lyase subunit beta / citryl-CoA lyase
MKAFLGGPALLFCPGNRPDRFLKAHARADSVILDLEDAVGASDKFQARRDVCAALPELGDNAIVRVNAPGTPWHKDDVAALRTASAQTIMVPKVESPSQLDSLTGFDVIAICETAAGVLHSEAIASHPQCIALLWGGEDLIADLGGRRSRSPQGVYHGVVAQARHSVLLAAAAAGKFAIDAIHVDFTDMEGLRKETSEAVDMGFDAKACIHPNNVGIIREQFAPTQTELTWAAEVLAMADSHGGDVFAFQGSMIDEPLLLQARRIINPTQNSGGK